MIPVCILNGALAWFCLAHCLTSVALHRLLHCHTVQGVKTPVCNTVKVTPRSQDSSQGDTIVCISQKFYCSLSRVLLALSYSLSDSTPLTLTHAPTLLITKTSKKRGGLYQEVLMQRCTSEIKLLGGQMALSNCPPPYTIYIRYLHSQRIAFTEILDDY